MRRPFPVLLLLAGGLLLLVSLYLPWQEASLPSGQGFSGQRGDVAGLLNLFSGSRTVDGWSSGVGEAAALFALLLAAVAGAALVRPNLAGRLPLSQCALFAGYFGIAVGVQARSVAHQRKIGLDEVDFHWAYGAYLGIAAGVLVLLAAGAIGRGKLLQHHSAFRLAALVLNVGLLVALLLPWQRFVGPVRITLPGIGTPAAVVAGVFALWLLFVQLRPDPAARTERLVLTAAVALFTGAAFSSLTFGGSHAYGAWFGLGVAAALAAFALIECAQFTRPARPPWLALATGAAAGLVVTSLFLPWQTACYATGSDFGPYSGRCVSTNGWTATAGTAAAVLAIALIVVTLAPWRRAASVVELAAGTGLLVATLGFQLTNGGGSDLRFEFGYGSTVGFAGAALLGALAVARLRAVAIEWNRVPARLAPIAACAAYLVVVVVPWWDVLPAQLQSALSFAPLSWLTIAGALLGIHLLLLWARQVADAPGGDVWLVVIPLALLSLAALDLVRLRDDGMSWGGGVVAGLCLLLALLGRLEQRVGLEHLRVPEVLRVDRL
jgi:hypothetical protein